MVVFHLHTTHFIIPNLCLLQAQPVNISVTLSFLNDYNSWI